MGEQIKNAIPPKFVYGVIRKRAPAFAVAFAVLFTLIAGAQYLVVRHGVYKSAESRLLESADQVAAEIAYKDKWDLAAHRQSADIQAIHLFVTTSEGLVIDTLGFVPGLIGPVRPLDESIFIGPKTVKVPETGEVWMEYAVKVKGGAIALGILNPQEVSAPEEFLRNAARQFGSTIEDAMKVRSRQIPSQVDYAIIDDLGNLLFEADWFPLRLEPSSVSALASLHGLVQEGGKSYLVVSKPIKDFAGRTVGTITIPHEVTAEAHVIRQHILFNAIATLACWLAALLVVVLYLAVQEWRSRPQATSLEAALKGGESQEIEFKEGHADVPLQRAIAAFANTNNGTIFLGVNNKAEVVGIDCDTPQSKDEELQRIRNITTQAIKPAISVRADFLAHHAKTVLRIFVPRGEQPLYFLNHEIYVREQTSSMKATPEQVEGIVSKFYR